MNKPKSTPKVGQRYGRLVITVLHKQRYTWAECRCDCGESTFAAFASLTKGATRSCGCLQRELASQRTTIHGARAGREPDGKRQSTPEYRTWQAMRNRCLDSSDKDYPRYGGRGIAVCERWANDFAAFFADMGPRPPGMTIDRFPNNRGNYEPGNCRWATSREQGWNKRNNVVITIEGETKFLADWCLERGVNYQTAYWRLKQGRSPAVALTP